MHLNTVCESVDSVQQDLLVRLSNGAQLRCDVVIGAVGLEANRSLADTAGIAVERGITVNQYLETNQADIYALGDGVEICGLILPYVAPISQCAKALAHTLTGTPTPVSFAAMPVTVKTPDFPVVICPPMSAEGTWSNERLDKDSVRSLFRAPDGELLGFALTGDLVVEQRTLAREIRPWLPA